MVSEVRRLQYVMLSNETMKLMSPTLSLLPICKGYHWIKHKIVDLKAQQRRKSRDIGLNQQC